MWKLQSHYHLFQESVPVFSQFDIPSPSDKPALENQYLAQGVAEKEHKEEKERKKNSHFDGSLWSKVGLQDILEALGGVNVHV